MCVLTPRSDPVAGSVGRLLLTGRIAHEDRGLHSRRVWWHVGSSLLSCRKTGMHARRENLIADLLEIGSAIVSWPKWQIFG